MGVPPAAVSVALSLHVIIDWITFCNPCLLLAHMSFSGAARRKPHAMSGILAPGF